ncbi:hypothetical protein K432DRAFT_118319 [Lepidopterella palustris CBS 459.81]|uniref:Uncharacterized protein n=1 Tax=Lepidopterella palustris CBS 459.81 TaxID=1314670 RepID=A0A8E2E5E0_9PEZI|nr:hypothetical protein K432DRAFT_118319 [Lepidopterella palustris CBS 459.81]
MCQKRAKIFTCGCQGDPRLEACRSAIIANSCCEDIPIGPERKSYFPCYNCIRKEVTEEKKAAVEKERREEEVRAKAEAEAKGRESRDGRWEPASGRRGWGGSGRGRRAWDRVGGGGSGQWRIHA